MHGTTVSVHLFMVIIYEGDTHLNVLYKRWRTAAASPLEHTAAFTVQTDREHNTRTRWRKSDLLSLCNTCEWEPFDFNDRLEGRRGDGRTDSEEEDRRASAQVK